MARTVGSTPYARRRGPRWGGIVAVLLLAAEIASLVVVGKLVGPGITLLLLLLQAALGFWVIRREARRAFRDLRGRTTTPDGVTVTDPAPGWEMTHAPLGVLGGLLLTIPGFLSDVAALFLLLPPTRTLASKLLKVAVLDRLVRQWTVVTVQGSTTTVRTPDGTTRTTGPDGTTRVTGPGGPWPGDGSAGTTGSTGPVGEEWPGGGPTAEGPTVIRGEIADRDD